MKMIIYETTHFENLSALIELCNMSFEELTIFLTQKSHEQILPVLKNLQVSIPIHFEVQAENEGNRAFIKRFFKYIDSKQFTHLHINTLDHNVLYFTYFLKRLPAMHISMTVHSINGYKAFRFNSLKSITEAIAKWYLHRRIKNYLVLAPAMVDYFNKKFGGKKCVFIPGNFFDERSCRITESDQSFFTVVIPGTVEAKRRDYALIIRFFRNHLPVLSQLKPIKLVLAGNSGLEYGQLVVKDFEALANEQFSVEYFNHEIEMDVYTTLFSNADIVWNPIIPETLSLENVPEQSSLSHSPGFITDQIRLGRPGIIPATVKVHETLKDCNFYYETEEDLKSIFLKIMSNEEYLLAKKEETINACRYFQPGNFQTAFQQLTSLYYYKSSLHKQVPG